MCTLFSPRLVASIPTAELHHEHFDRGKFFTLPRELALPSIRPLYLKRTATKIPHRIAEAEKAILGRIKELFFVGGDHIEEDQSLDDALYGLRALRNCVCCEWVTA